MSDFYSTLFSMPHLSTTFFLMLPISFLVGYVAADYSTKKGSIIPYCIAISSISFVSLFLRLKGLY